MADIKRVSPADAKALMDGEGYTYVDVRSVPEFEEEHPEHAYNIPLMHMGPGGMAPNPEFLAVFGELFPKDAKVVVGCKSGGRSMRAAHVLAQQGFTHVVDQRAGWDGARDPFGQVTEKGWKAAGLPSEKGDGGPKGWTTLKGRLTK